MVTYSEAAILNHNDLKMDEQRFLMNQCVNRATEAEVTAMNEATQTSKLMLAGNYNWPKGAIPENDTRYFLPDTPGPPTLVVEQADNEQDPQSGNGKKKGYWKKKS